MKIISESPAPLLSLFVSIKKYMSFWMSFRGQRQLSVDAFVVNIAAGAPV